ncbi:MAG: hypothetical protein GF401_11515 [Chitinivibrionales bacterium]|nr:hypothetical protein [Chitinivibrionales bacterium]
MKYRLLISLISAFLFGGCAVYENPVYVPEDERDGTTTIIIDDTPLYVDTYLSLPDPILEILAPHVQGYFSPRQTRYGNFLYYQDYPRYSYNLPCYVKADFNGDYRDDYAFLFTHEEQYYDYWAISTKLLVVLSTSSYYELAVEMDLGTVEAGYDYPIEEYWSISLLPEGTHTYTSCNHGVEVVEDVVLDMDAIVLSFLETEEQDLIYADAYNDIYYMTWDPGSLAKRRSLGKSSAGKKVEINWKDKLTKKAKEGTIKK